MIGQKQVNPKIATAILVVVLGTVQWFWWKGLLSKPKPVNTAPRGGAGPPPMPPRAIGDPNVKVDTLAGEPDPGDRDGPGYAARFDAPVAIALDPQGNLIVADSGNHRIRRVSPTGTATTVAGSDAGFADGPAAQAKFQMPSGVAVAPDGTIYVADAGNHRIRQIRNGVVTTLAGGERGLADGAGAAARFDTPCGIGIGAGGDLIVADTGNRRLRTVRRDGVVTRGAPTVGIPTGVAVGPEGVVVAASGGLATVGGAVRNRIPVLAPGGILLGQPVALSPAPQGWYVTDARNHGVFRVDGSGATLLAGFSVPPESKEPTSGWTDGPGTRARFGRVAGLVSDGKGTIYVCDTTNNAIRRVFLPGAAPEENGGTL